jgi:hypothetical protein
MHAIIELGNELHILTITEYPPTHSAGAESFASIRCNL